MDERYDLVRVVRDQRFIYIRNYMPHKIYGQHISYMFQTPTTQKWHDLFHAGKLNAAQSRFWKTKPTEELYDLQVDPDEVNNLAGSKKHATILERLRKAHVDHTFAIRDVGFLPEGQIHSRAGEGAPYDIARDKKSYPLKRIHLAADIASEMNPDAIIDLKKMCSDPDSAVRYWAVMGFLMRGEKGVAAGQAQLRRALNDKSPAVACIAAEALSRFGQAKDADRALKKLLQLADGTRNSIFTAMLALNALDHAGDRAKPHAAAIAALPRKAKVTPPRMGNYLLRLIEKTTADLGHKPKPPKKLRGKRSAKGSELHSVTLGEADPVR